MPNILVPLADGFEEIEAITIIDILRRAGMTVTVAGDPDENGIITGRTKIKISPDCSLEDIAKRNLTEFDAIVLPGGLGGTQRLQQDDRIKSFLQHLDRNDGIIAAICAAPTILSACGLLKGKVVTSHPSVKNDLHNAIYKDDRVVIDGRIITSQGPGTAMEFSFALVEYFYGKKKVLEINQGVLAKV